jgi:hypothetical protein
VTKATAGPHFRTTDVTERSAGVKSFSISSMETEIDIWALCNVLSAALDCGRKAVAVGIAKKFKKKSPSNTTRIVLVKLSILSKFHLVSC